MQAREPQEIITVLQGIDERHPAEELEIYEHVLDQLTELLNTPEERAPGVSQHDPTR